MMRVSSCRRLAARPRRLLLVFAALSLGGCATFSDSFAPIENHLLQDQPRLALQALEKQKYGMGDRVLYLLDKGMLLRMVNDYAGSNQAFEAAKKRIDELYGASVSQTAASFLVNDSTRAYAGEPYERALIHLYMALNYLQLGKLDDARIEAQQVELTEREEVQSVSKRRYMDDGLARYLTGKIYEELGEWSDARISYRQAYDAYREYARRFGFVMPRFVEYDLLRLTQREGLNDEYRRLSKRFALPVAAPDPTRRGRGEIIFMLHEGLAPIKREHSTTVVNPQNGRLIRISLPAYERRNDPVVGARITVGDTVATTELADDINNLALQDLEARMSAITARALARAVAKDITARQAQKENGLLGLAVNLTNVLTERADTRSWLTLPATIHLADMVLAPGTYTVKVELLGRSGAVLAVHEFANVSVAERKKTYLSYHWISPESRALRRQR